MVAVPIPPSVLVPLSVAVVTVLLLAPGVALVLVRYPELCTLSAWTDRLRERVRPVVVLSVVVGVKILLEGAVPSVSWLVGWNVTGLIYGLEGEAVTVVQSVASPPLTTYFTFVYVYVFAALLVFPILVSLAHPDSWPIREAVVAYSLNYLLGLSSYVAFIAYGPRNHLPGRVSSLLYVHWPEAYLLTSSMNANTNVFPSLHVSFAVTVALLAWRTRSAFPLWPVVASGLAASVTVATVYLGIHWITDAVAGALLGAACVWIAARYPLGRVGPVLGRTVDRARRQLLSSR